MSDILKLALKSRDPKRTQIVRKRMNNAALLDDLNKAVNLFNILGVDNEYAASLLSGTIDIPDEIKDIINFFE